MSGKGNKKQRSEEVCLCKLEVHSNFLGQRDMSSTREEVTGLGDV